MTVTEHLLRRLALVHTVVAPTRTRAKVLDRGATAVEYALMVTLIAVVIISAVTLFGLSVVGLFSNAAPQV